MKLISWNVRGLGNPSAKNALRQLITAEKPDVLFFSETKLSSVDFERFCRSCGFINVVAHDSDGASGGVGLCWVNSININLLSYDYNYIDVDVLDDGEGNNWRLTGFYGEPEPSRRHESWSLLRNLATRSDLPWLCIGDFNEILYSYEKKGGRRRNRNQIAAFQSAVTDTELIDIMYRGTWYTWQRGGVNSPLIRCRLDRGLATNGWWDLVTNFCLKHLVNAHSDHCPIMLTTGQSNADSDPIGVPSSRFCASWTQDQECEEVVRSTWDNAAGTLNRKITAVLAALVRWSDGKFKGRKRKKKKLQRRLDRLALLDPDDDVLNEMLEVKTALTAEINQEEALWAQRAHINWLREGDRNTAFFHKSASYRRRSNAVRNLLSTAGVQENTTSGMLRIAVDYFTSLFTTSNPTDFGPVLSGIETKVNADMNASICREYTAIEVKEALFSMGANKASGPDGMTALFYQKFWHIAGEEVTKFCLDFLNGDVDITEINNTNVILLPKSDNPERMQHFRPISLSNVLYKIIAKTLANRFKGILDVCIDPAQSAFIPGRLISDNVLIAYELLHTLKNKRSGADGRFALKMDMSKAYDRVEWNYLEAVMLKMGFATQFVGKIMHCVRTVSYSVILNGSLSEEFRPSRGIRQGDPLSTYLFLIYSEGLSSLLRVAQEEGVITGLQASANGPSLTHLLFADDAIIFGEASTDGATKLRDIIQSYGDCSGQQVNYGKSLIYFSSNTQARMRNDVKMVLRVRVENNPEKYLGLPCMVGRDRTSSFQYLRDRMFDKVQNWTTRFLSQAGKEVFIKAVLQSLPTYAMGCFLLPKGLCNKMNAVMSKYWWRGREDKSGVYWAKWSKVCMPKSQGGLGFRELGKFNIAMLAKQGWRLITNTESLVARVLKAKYYPNSSFLEARIGNKPSLTWRSVWSARGLLEKGVCWRIGNGISIRTFFDQWVPGLPVHKVTPVITRLNPIGRVAEYIDFHTMQWKESRLREVLSAPDVEKILGIHLPWEPCPDTVGWQFSNTGEYTVSSGYKVLTNSHPSQANSNNPNYVPEHAQFYKKLWQMPLPPKVLHHVWRVFKGFTPTQFVMYNRYVSHSPLCPRCGIDDETPMHAFKYCSVFAVVWQMLDIQWDPGTANENIQDWLIALINSVDLRKVRKILIVLWANWQNCNAFIHEGKQTTATELKVFVELYLAEIDGSLPAPRIVSSSDPKPGWAPPPRPFLKANFDAGYCAQSKCSFTGVVIRDSNGYVKVVAAIKTDKVDSPMEAEAHACLQAMQVAFSYGFQQLIFEGDSRSIIKYIQQQGTNRSIIAPIIQSCKQYIRDFSHCMFNFVDRKANLCAHSIASKRRCWDDDRLWTDSVPSDIQLLVELEKPSP